MIIFKSANKVKMILETTEAQAIVEQYANKPPKFIQEGREYNTLLNQLVNGIDFQELLSKIEHIEMNDAKFKARKKYARSIKDLNERLLRPIENVFSATGGSKTFDLTGDAMTRAINAINTCRGNKSLTRFMSTIWKEAYVTDPMGLMFVEVSTDGEKAYPTYKSIQDVQYYKAVGQNVEYVMFKPYKVVIDNRTFEVVRLVDDAMNHYFYKEGNDWKHSEEDSFPHIFGICPAVINSDLEVIGADTRTSIIDKVIDIQKEFLRDQSILTLVKFLNGFQNLIRPRVLCSDCHGTGKKGDKACTSCDSVGYLINKDITDEIIIPIDLNNPDQKIPSANDIGKYFGLDVETWNQYRGELKVLEILIYEALWGTHMQNQENKTATAKFIDTQPVINKLNMIADGAEFVEQELANLIVKHTIPSLNKDEKYVTISNGRRFIIDPPDALLESYQTARAAGMNLGVLDRMYNEYLTAKYKNDEETLRIILLKAKAEPYLHYTAEQVKTIINSDEAFRKVMFSEFWKTINNPLSYDTADQIQADFEAYLIAEKAKRVGTTAVPDSDSDEQEDEEEQARQTADENEE